VAEIARIDLSTSSTNLVGVAESDTVINLTFPPSPPLLSFSRAAITIYSIHSIPIQDQTIYAESDAAASPVENRVEGQKDAIVNPIVILRASGKLGSTVDVCPTNWQ
jgi:hypothetical protein